MPLYRNLKEVYTTRHKQQAHTCGLVPTMGALHQGHLALITKAQQENEYVWVTIFVNPTQFNNSSNLDKYPERLMEDVKAIHQIDSSIHIFAPSTKEMYPEKATATKYLFNGLNTEMEGKHRKGHFEGVSTIVSKLFEAIKPHRAYFGEKGFIYNTLKYCVTNGLQKAAIYSYIVHAFGKHPKFTLHYALCVNEDTLKEVYEVNTKKKQRIFVATTVEGVRLIDNIALK